MISATFIIALAAIVPEGSAHPVATVVSGPGSLKGVALCEFEDDSITLVVTVGGKEIAREHFCSAYGKGAAQTVSDVDGREFILLSFSQGHGTNATQEYLSVYRLAPNLVEYVRIPISGGAGPQSRWHYDYRVETPATGGIRLVLSRRVEGEDAEWVPAEERRVIEVGRRDS